MKVTQRSFLGMTQDFVQSPQTALERTLQHYWPGITSRQVAAMVSARVDRTTVTNWRCGRYRPPAWFIEDLRQRIAAFDAVGRELVAQAQKETGPGRKAGAINIKRWLATKGR